MSSTGMPDETRKLIDRLENATAAMAALEDEVDALRHRLETADVAAIHLGVRRIVEALLRHANRAEAIELPKNGSLQTLKDGLRSKVRERLVPQFWRHLDVVQDAVNPNTHYQQDDVYRPPSEFRRPNPWDEILNVFRSLVCIAEEFAHHWPPPPELVAPATVVEPVATGAVQEAESGDDDEDGDDDAPDEPRPKPRVKLAAEQTAILRGMTVAEARDSDDVRAWLSDASGLHTRGVSRRLNASHGAKKLRNVFPTAFEATEGERDDDAEDTPTLDYQAIGNLTVKQARDFELADDIATLSGLSSAVVRRRLKDLHGAAVVRRQFPWYFAGTIGDLTVGTARRYNLTPVLAIGLGERPLAILGKLREAAGQTKLRTVFPKLLDGAE